MTNIPALYEHVRRLAACNSPLMEMELQSIEENTMRDGVGAITRSFGTTDRQKVIDALSCNTFQEIFETQCRGFPHFEKDRSKTEPMEGTEDWGVRKY